MSDPAELQAEAAAFPRRFSAPARQRRAGDRRPAARRGRRAHGDRRGRQCACSKACPAGQDGAGQDARARARSRFSAHPIHARPHAGGHRRHERHERPGRTDGTSSSSGAGRSSRSSCSRTKSTARRRRRSPRCWRRCRKAASPPRGRRIILGQPFFVLATQNPLEQEGTYPLPEAQLDRFMFKLNVPFLNRAELNEVVRRTTLGGTSMCRRS